MRKNLLKQILALVALAAAFVMVSYLAHVFKAQLADIVQAGGVIGILGFVALTAIFVVFVIPLDIVFLIPIGVVVWGPVPTAFMSITGWTLGAAVAFSIARVFGGGVVGRLIGLSRVQAIERRIPKRNLFGAVVVLRMLVSVDILSYALGLFSTMPWKQYVFATLLGVTPFGFYFAFAGTLPLWYQVAAIGIAVVLASAIILIYGMRREP